MTVFLRALKAGHIKTGIIRSWGGCALFTRDKDNISGVLHVQGAAEKENSRDRGKVKNAGIWQEGMDDTKTPFK